MEERLLAEKICSGFTVLSIDPSQGEFWMKPAWKFAYYNAAKKEQNGSVEIYPARYESYLVAALASIMTIMALVLKAYTPALVGISIVVIILLLTKLIPRKKMIFDKAGIKIPGNEFKWSDFDGAYIAMLAIGKQRHAMLVLAKGDEPAVYINISHYIDVSKVATPVRDFQPASYKVRL
ncbi:hypothetical protein SAMN05444266_108120 [Chitinophaga jiangningensis]|uniref:Uncharacterized protein n=1 Tax=Chitinophaga jiangningensis TaxID=1419482 RepID=A0A1M7IW73_9BACT|nr:hypothetical protein [Chitinophaga jiangningensis]SHM44976.1 hypothetical protein SAMN05444266_108120 [Chitinophaga jiangningensis]